MVASRWLGPDPGDIPTSLRLEPRGFWVALSFQSEGPPGSPKSLPWLGSKPLSPAEQRDQGVQAAAAWKSLKEVTPTGAEKAQNLPQ